MITDPTRHLFFISDVHLESGTHEEQADRRRRLFSFFDSLPGRCSALFICGDFFDFWFDYRKAIPRQHFEALYQLRKLIHEGIEIHYLAGNHDFYLGDFLKDQVGLQTHYDRIEFELNEKRFFVHHGDGLSKNDRAYRFFRWTLRNKTNIRLYKLLHPDLGIPLAHYLSRYSRGRNAEYQNGFLPHRDDQKINAFIRNKFQAGFDYVIMGHYHHPVKLDAREWGYENRVYLNTGDWLEHFTYAEYDHETLHLRNWPLNQETQ